MCLQWTRDPGSLRRGEHPVPFPLGDGLVSRPQKQRAWWVGILEHNWTMAHNIQIQKEAREKQDLRA